MALTLGELLRDRPPLVTAREEESAKDALERMLEHDYSQLPVVVDHLGGERALGLVTTTSVVRAALHLGVAPASLRVKHALEAHSMVASWGEDLWRTLDRAQDGRAILVIDEEKRLKGILTGYDFTQYLRTLSEDSVALADIEVTVKALILRRFEGDEDGLSSLVLDQARAIRRGLMGAVKKVVEACRAGDPTGPELSGVTYKAAFEQHMLGDVLAKFEDLSFAQYVAIFLGPECWKFYETKLDVPISSVKGILDSIRILRNRLAHNRGTLTPVERNRVAFCRDLLYAVADSEPETAVALDGTYRGAADGRDEADVAQEESPAGGDMVPDDIQTSIYSGLAVYMLRLDAVEKRITYPISFVQTLVQDRLPPSARTSRSWWDTDPDKPQGATWLSIGWRVASVNLTLGTVTFARNSELGGAYIRAFKALFRVIPKGRGVAGSRSPSGASWQTIAYFPAGRASGSRFILWFTGGGRFGLALYINIGGAARSKDVFDRLLCERSEIEEEVGEALEWSRLDDARASRIAVYFPEPFRITTGDENLESICAWAKRLVPAFLKAFSRRAEDVLAEFGDGQNAHGEEKTP